MGQSKLSLRVAEFGQARALMDRLSAAEEPLAHAVTMFERPRSPAGFENNCISAKFVNANLHRSTSP